MSHVIWPDWKIRAYLDGRVTQFRVPVPMAKYFPERIPKGVFLQQVDKPCLWDFFCDAGRAQVKAPYEPGETVCVKETYCIESNHNIDDESTYPPPWSDGRPVKRYENDRDGHYWEQAHYKATDPTPELSYDGSSEPGCHWESPATMPRWASRINPLITSVKVEKLEKISEDDCEVEGIPPQKITYCPHPLKPKSNPRFSSSITNCSHKEAYKIAWDSTHKPSQRFADGIWVWAVTVKGQNDD